jgi:hypothetical protein
MNAAPHLPVRDLVAEALDRAPKGKPFPPEVLAELDQAMADIQAGRGVRHEDVPAWIEEQTRLAQAG